MQPISVYTILLSHYSILSSFVQDRVPSEKWFYSKKIFLQFFTFVQDQKKRRWLIDSLQIRYINKSGHLTSSTWPIIEPKKRWDVQTLVPSSKFRVNFLLECSATNPNVILIIKTVSFRYSCSQDLLFFLFLSNPTTPDPPLFTEGLLLMSLIDGPIPSI